MNTQIGISPLRTPYQLEGNGTEPLYWVEVTDFARAFCGALFLALPLHFTMEMWALARSIPALHLILIIVVSYLLNVGYHFYSGFNGEADRQSPWLDSLSSMGIAFVASAVTLLLIDQLSHEMTFAIVVKCIALEMVPTSFGASLAKSQLGGSSSEEHDLTDRWSVDSKKIVAATLGALMFSFNVAATQEPIIIATAIKPIQLIGIVLFSLFVSYLMIFIAGFKELQDDEQGNIMGTPWAETVVCYVISLLVSAALLWMFGYLSVDTPISMILPWVVVLGYATTLGGSAGRLII